MRLAGHVARFVGGQKNRQRGHFLHGSQTPDGLAGDKCVPGEDALPDQVGRDRTLI